MILLTTTTLVGGFLILVLGGFLGYLGRSLFVKRRLSSAEEKFKKIISQAKQESQEIIIAAKNEALNIKGETVKEEKERQEAIRKIEEKILKKEEQLDLRAIDYQKKERSFEEEIKKVKDLKLKIEEIKNQEIQKIEQIANLTKEEAKVQLFSQLEKEEKENLTNRLRKLINENTLEVEKKAKELLTYTMQRFASPQASEVSTFTINVPNEEIKGKIIGKEGRNIRVFEKLTGVTLIVDDTPGAITLSCFDPVRRTIAKIALEKLIADGRIQPARIEEIFERSKEEVEKEITKKAEEALYELGLSGVESKLVYLLGRLHFRTSFGQNVLNHSIEMAYLSAMLAAELGADVKVVKMGALFHDIGKAVDHEVQGTHVEIGRKILHKFNIDNRVIQAMQSHHEEYPFETLESVIVQIADALSGGRPGARRGTFETYIKRLEDLEKIATSYEGVEKCYAISAGREIRVFVKPEVIDDFKALNLAKNIATKIESELKYPGEIKVNVIRETRSIEYAR